MKTEYNYLQTPKSNALMKLVLLCLLLITAGCQQKQEMDEGALIEIAKEIHERVITLDSHIDINVNHFTDSINYTQDLETQVNLPKMKKGGLDVAWFSVYTAQKSITEDGFAQAYKKAISKFDAIHWLTSEIAPNEIELATSLDDVKRINAAGKKIALIGVENGYPIGTDISRVREFYDLGARYLSLTHNGHNQLSDSNTGEKDGVWLHNGLSDLGKLVIGEMNKWGIIIDVSHLSKEAIRQIIEISSAPIIASHSSARTLSDHRRNLDDEQLEWIKRNKGVVQAVAYQAYINTKKYNARMDKINEIHDQVVDSLGVKWYSIEEFDRLSYNDQLDFLETLKKVTAIVEEKKKSHPDLIPEVNVSDFVDHIDYLVSKLGIEYVGISSDFDGGGGVEGWNDASETLNVTIELVKRGYSEEEIEHLWGGNILRLLDEVAQIAKEIQSNDGLGK